MTRTPAELTQQSPATADQDGSSPTARRGLWTHIPHGTRLDASEWARRHQVLQWVLGLHVPALFLLSLLLGRGLVFTAYLLLPTIVLLGLSQALRPARRVAAVLNTIGLTYCSVALVVITHGLIEAHFHFFIMIGLIALYQDWAPIVANIVLTVISHGLGSALQADLIFNHGDAQHNPWVWSAIHGVAVLVAYAGVVAFWGITEDDQNERAHLVRRLSEAKAAQQAAALEDINAVFLNIAHRSQAIVHRQLQVLDKAERAEEDPDQLGLLFQLDHLTTRERRNAENLIILGGGQPGRQWRNPVPLLELVRSAASETEQYTRVALGRMPRMLVAGRAVGDLIHLIAELLDNATSFSPPDARIDVRGNRVGKGVVLEIEDQGLGIEPERMEQLNEMLRSDSSIGPSAKSQDWRLGLFVVSRLARRHGINVTLVESAYGGVRAIALVPMTLLTDAPDSEFDDDGSSDLALAGTVPPPRPSTNGNGHRPQPRPRHARNGTAAEETVQEAPATAAPDEAVTAEAAPAVTAAAPPEAPAAPATAAPADAVATSGTAVTGIVPNGAAPNGAAPNGVAEARPTPRPSPIRPGLPTRRRQSHVAAQLRDEPGADMPQRADDTAEVPTVDTFTVADDAAAQAARSRMTAFQRGTAGGRADTVDNS